MLAKHFRAWLESILSVQGFFGYHRETRFLERIAQLAESLRRARRPISRELSPQGKNGKYDEHASEADCREAAGTMRISIPRALKECFSETCHLVHISPQFHRMCTSNVSRVRYGELFLNSLQRIPSRFLQ